MSYNLPGQYPGPQGTEPPSTPCTGDFFDKLHCRENGWFLWVGAFCVLVVILGLCSCYVVTPISQWLRGLLETDGSKRRVSVAPAEEETSEKAARRKSSLKPMHSKSVHEHNHHWYLDDALKITREDEMELGPRPPTHTVPTAEATAVSTWAPSKRQGRDRHKRRASWAHNKRRDHKELLASPARRSSMSSNRAASKRSMLYGPSSASSIKTRERADAANYTRRSRQLTADLVVEDPGIGAEATLRGGGWMGADNGRL